MAKIVVLGAGVMGSAFTMPLADNGHTVSLVGTHLDADIVEEIHETRVHPRLKSRLRDAVTPYTYDRLGEVIQGADLVVVGVNSLGIDWAGEMLRPVLPPGIPLLFLTKGLAGELAEERDTCVVLTGSDAALVTRLAALLRTRYYHVWPSTDMVGVETCVAMKNLYALAVGCVSGLLARDGKAGNEAVMHNLAAGIFAQGLWETAYLVDYMGGQRRSVFTLPGAGDLYVTSMGGRNSRMGWHLGQGVAYSVAKRDFMPDDTIEGAQLAQAIGPTVEHLVAAGKLAAAALPLALTMIDIVCHDAPVVFPWDAFFADAADGLAK